MSKTEKLEVVIPGFLDTPLEGFKIECSDDNLTVSRQNKNYKNECSTKFNVTFPNNFSVEDSYSILKEWQKEIKINPDYLPSHCSIYYTKHEWMKFLPYWLLKIFIKPVEIEGYPVIKICSKEEVSAEEITLSFTYNTEDKPND